MKTSKENVITTVTVRDLPGRELRSELIQVNRPASTLWQWSQTTHAPNNHPCISFSNSDAPRPTDYTTKYEDVERMSVTLEKNPMPVKTNNEVLRQRTRKTSSIDQKINIKLTFFPESSHTISMVLAWCSSLSVS